MLTSISKVIASADEGVLRRTEEIRLQYEAELSKEKVIILLSIGHYLTCLLKELMVRCIEDTKHSQSLLMDGFRNTNRIEITKLKSEFEVKIKTLNNDITRLQQQNSSLASEVEKQKVSIILILINEIV